VNTGWATKPLGDLFEIGAGKTVSAATRNGSNKVPFLRTSNVFWDRLDLSTLDEMSINEHELADKLLKPGDLLVCEGGDIGRAAIWDGSVERIAFQNHLHRLRPKADDVQPRFYVYFLQSAFTQLGIFAGTGNKTTIPNLSSSRLAALDVPHPPLPVQNDIVQALRAIREAITVHENATTTAEELKRAVVNQLFMRGLGGELQKETEIGPVPESWDVVPLGSMGRIGNGSTPKKSIGDYWEGGSFPWLTSAKVYDRDIETADQFVTATALQECHLPVVKPGALLVAITGQGKTLGHCAVLRIEATISQHLAYLQTDVTMAEPEFIRAYLDTRYSYLRQVASAGGSTKGALTCAFLRELPIPLPAAEEQREIAGIFRALDREVDVHRRKRALLEELFRSLLHKLMTGEVSVDQLDLSCFASAFAARAEATA
jgi:type I restriction enzyme S subunit